MAEAPSSETKIIRLIIDSSKAVDGGKAAQRALEAVEKQTAGMSGTLERMEKGLASFGNMLKYQLVAMASLAVLSLAGLAKEAFSSAAGLAELAEQLGTTSDYLQGMQFSAVQAGVKLEQLETGMSKFSQKMGEAADGSKDVIEALTKLGVKNLDLKGNLRPTEDLMQDVAKAILSIEDPARRSAAMVDLFGKTGTRMLPMLKDVAEGAHSLVSKAGAAGAMISAEAIEKLDHLADGFERSKLKARAFFAENMAQPLTSALEAVGKVAAEVVGYIKELMGVLDDLWSKAKGIVRENETNAVRKNLLPDAVKKSNAWDAYANDQSAALDRMKEGLTPDSWQQLGKIGKQQSEVDRANAMANRARSEVDRLTAIIINNGLEPGAEPAPVGRSDYDLPPVVKGPTTGVGTSKIKGEGDDVAERRRKALMDSQRSFDQQLAFSSAADLGAESLGKLEVHFKALEAAQGVFGKTTDQNKAGVEELTATLEKQALATLKLKNLANFKTETVAMRDQNELLAAELRLMKEAPEIRARELAVLKTMQEVKKLGIEDDKVAVDQRIALVEQQELLKQKIEDTKKAEELWTAPLKQALANIQSATADMFDSMLERGSFSFDELGKIWRVAVRRMIAEFAALALIRPALGGVAEGFSSLGLISQSTVRSMGYGGAGAGGAGIAGAGGGNPLASLGGGSGGGLFGNAFGFLYQPIVSGSLPAGASGPLLPGASYGGLGSITWGQGLGAAAGFGMGAYQLATSRSTAGTLGGIGSMIGAGVSLIPGLQPIGLGISLLSSILPGLFGGGEAPIPQQPDLGLGVGTFSPSARGRFTSSGYGQNGVGSLGAHAGGIGEQVSKLFRGAGLMGVEGSVIGGRIWSGVDHTFNAGNRNWDNRPYTQVGLVNPNGQQEMITYNDSSRNMEQAADLLIAAVFKANVERGGVTGASASLRTALSTIDPKTMADTQNLVTMVSAYDKLGKTQNTVKESIDQLGASFDDLRNFAVRAGLSLEPIDNELAKRTKRTAQDFIDNMLDPIAVQMRAFNDERDSAMASAQYIKDNITGVYVDMAKIAEYYLRKEAALRDQLYNGAITSLQDAIQRLTLGDLSNLSPTSTLNGVQAAYEATRAQTQTGDAAAIARFSSEGNDYVTLARSIYGSTQSYEQIRAQVLRDYLALQSQLQGGSGGSSSGGALNDNNDATQAALANVVQLSNVVRTQSEQIERLTATVTELIDAQRRQNAR